MDGPTIQCRHIGPDGVRDRNDLHVAHTWTFDLGVASFEQRYSTILPDTREFRHTVYLRPSGSVATFPYWKELPAALSRFSHPHYRSALWRGAADSLLGEELLPECRALRESGNKEDERLAAELAELMAGRIRFLSKECEHVIRRAKSRRYSDREKQRAVEGIRAILEWAQIPAGATDDLLELIPKVVEWNNQRLKAWENLVPAKPSFGGGPAWEHGQ